MSSPWAKIEKLEPVNLEDIMSEEVARDLQAKEEKHYMDIIGKNKEPVTAGSAAVVEDIPDEVLKAISGDELENDTLIAQMLQMQFDKEYDEELKRTELKFNGASKVSISYDKYRRAPLNYDFESDDEEEEIPDIRDRKNWDRFDVLKKEIASIPYCGYRRQNDGNMITKHDVVLNGRKKRLQTLIISSRISNW
ncbi:hypothetical protein NQ318_014014 [Aromia moschata]|uniref:Uncharacterized protein n=1 Tax=Aromia moschata TaxID=1265417 RepID=A0AAV8YZZ2_9CUCU|nr:hypothetical protein NQ318_014014 [Aromia moschata]